MRGPTSVAAKAPLPTFSSDIFLENFWLNFSVTERWTKKRLAAVQASRMFPSVEPVKLTFLATPLLIQ